MIHARVSITGLLLALLNPGVAAAQVGHPPDASPYHAARVRQYLTFSGAYLTGGEGAAGAGPSDGFLGGVRWDIRLGAPTYAHIGLSAGALQRVIIDPQEGPAARIQDTVTQSVYMAEGGLGLALTGQKTWHGFAPYVAASLGIAFGGSVPADSSGFQFRTRFVLGPLAGVRWHISNRLHFRVEGRDIVWPLSYPTVFFTEPANAPGEPPVLNPDEMKSTEWVHHPTLVFSIGYALRM
jgi:hypothetical protein